MQVSSPPAEGRPGDWKCPQCANHNYASRIVCNRCHGPRQVEGDTTAQPVRGNGTARPSPGDWYCPNPACCNLNYASRLVCNRCKTPPASAALYLQQAAVMWGLGVQLPMLQGSRPGDWLCMTCQNHNYASRTVCNRCQAAKPEVAAPLSSLGMAVPGLGTEAKPAAPSFRAGDWMCPQCGNHNYASRKKCNRCNQPKTTPESSEA
eukprot:EG_transcript_18157